MMIFGPVTTSEQHCHLPRSGTHLSGSTDQDASVF